MNIEFEEANMTQQVIDNTAMNYTAEIRCCYCGSLWGHKPGYDKPGLITHGLLPCCWEWAISQIEKWEDEL